jgi:hypothetical protein
MTNTYLAGNLVRVTAAFANAAGAAADPTTVTLEYRPGLGAALTTVVYPTAPIIKDSVGNYHADLDTTGSNPGVTVWDYGWFGTGTVQAVSTGAFTTTQPII